MKSIYALLLLCCLFPSGCRSPQTLTTDTRQKSVKDVENNISLVEASTLDEVVSRALQQFFNEKLSIDINHKVYDTAKPADPSTSRPPIKEETSINLNRETNGQQTDSTRVKKSERTQSQLADTSTDKSKFDGSEKTNTETGLKWWQKMFIAIGASCLIGFSIWLFIKIKFKR